MFAGNTAINKIISPKADTFLYLKRITLPKILACLESETGEIIMDNKTIKKARIPVERMIAVGR